MPLILTRSLVFLDLETTGTETANDRIVERSLVKFLPDKREEVNTFCVNLSIVSQYYITNIIEFTRLWWAI